MAKRQTWDKRMNTLLKIVLTGLILLVTFGMIVAGALILNGEWSVRAFVIYCGVPLAVLIPLFAMGLGLSVLLNKIWR